MDSPTARPRVLIATPVFDDNVSTIYARAIQELTLHLKGQVEFVLRFVGTALVHRARNAFASMVLGEEGFTHLLFVDSDMGFSPRVVERMLAFDKDVVGVVYPRRTIDLSRFHAVSRQVEDADKAKALAQDYVAPSLLKTALPDGRSGFVLDNGFVRATQAGTGLLLIKRQALSRMRDAFPDLVTHPGEQYAAFGLACDVIQVFEPTVRSDQGEFLSEDLSFCHRWVNDCGGEIWVCVDEVITHTGRMRFSGRYVDQLRGA